MQLTESNAGSDVGALRTRAERASDGTYRLKGTKIFITYGEHDMTDNIVHFVLARLPDAPAGTKGISLFLVPKYLVNADGSLGARNDIHASGVEHKLGMHASPTCTMTMGDQGGAIGYLIGEENRGMQCMFTMMNQARFGVGLEGVGIADRAYQQALAYAQERRYVPYDRERWRCGSSRGLGTWLAALQMAPYGLNFAASGLMAARPAPANSGTIRPV
jgi:acyl-CoA dehydrogenase